MSHTDPPAEDQALTWIEVLVGKKTRVPLWQRKAALAGDGTIFLSSAVIGSAMEAFLCASYDGTPVVAVGAHVYYPSGWIKKEFPEARDLATFMEEIVRKAVSSRGG